MSILGVLQFYSRAGMGFLIRNTVFKGVKCELERLGCHYVNAAKAMWLEWLVL
jgi:hypothetical protein